MAETLKSFTFQRMTGRYPWVDWTDGRIWKVKRGTDFKITAKGIRSAALAHAHRVGKRVNTSIVDDDTVVFQFYDKPEE